MLGRAVLRRIDASVEPGREGHERGTTQVVTAAGHVPTPHAHRGMPHRDNGLGKRARAVSDRRYGEVRTAQTGAAARRVRSILVIDERRAVARDLRLISSGPGTELHEALT